MSLFEKALASRLGSIVPVDGALAKKAHQRLDNLTKPRGSLGRLEEFAARVAAITGTTSPEVTKKTIFTFAGDHGVADEGVSAFPREVTAQMVLNFLAGGAGINVLARHAGADVVVVDMGVDYDFDGEPGKTPAGGAGLVSKKVLKKGTGNIRKGPAMTREEALACIEVGIGLSDEYASPGAVFGTGEMGIANTTPSSALIALFSSLPVEEVTGRGTGIDDEIYRRKVEVIKDALKVNAPDPADPVGALAKLGGAEIAGIAGLVIGAASRRIPVVIDGFISTAGALVAFELEPRVSEYLFAAHRSVERGHQVMLDRIGLEPFLDLSLRLGEGTGAALGISLIEAGVRIYNEMATFGDAGVSEEA
jgi:nicotinate-nucleotide--dimethylbenzimidazole phosphoribosyltransferase